MPRTTTQTPKENYELLLYRLDQIDRKLDEMSKNYVTKEEHEALRDEVKQEIVALKKHNLIDKILVTLFTSIIVSLTWYVISDIVKG